VLDGDVQRRAGPVADDAVLVEPWWCWKARTARSSGASKRAADPLSAAA
jgi:hypothetical protein